jgi:hypothetical protein
MPSNNHVLPGFSGLNLDRLGIMQERSFLNEYFRSSIRRGLLNITLADSGSGEWAKLYTFFSCLSFFRLASICQGVMKRAVQGNASSGRAKVVGGQAQILARIGCNLYQNQKSPPFSTIGNNFLAMDNVTIRLQETSLHCTAFSRASFYQILACIGIAAGIHGFVHLPK